MTASSSTAAPDFREIHHLDMRLTYADCDPAQILYFATWFPWMERVPTEWMFLNDLRQDTLQERFGFRTVTRSADCEYLVPAVLFDQIRISLAVTAIGRSSFSWGLRMVRVADGALVARGRISLVTLDNEGVPVTIPAPLRPALERVFSVG